MSMLGIVNQHKYCSWILNFYNYSWVQIHTSIHISCKSTYRNIFSMMSVTWFHILIRARKYSRLHAECEKTLTRFLRYWNILLSGNNKQVSKTGRVRNDRGAPLGAVTDKLPSFVRHPSRNRAIIPPTCCYLSPKHMICSFRYGYSTLRSCTWDIWIQLGRFCSVTR